MTKRGMVHIYCGDGKGKTTAAFGLALRCAGHGEPVVIVQFLKNGKSGECVAFQRFGNVQILHAQPIEKFTFQMTESEKQETKTALKMCFRTVVDKIQNQSVRMLVLDEIMAAMECGFIDCEDVIKFLQSKPESLEVVMTGRNPPSTLLNFSDYISEIQKVKHPFDTGIASREGIEW